MKINRKYIFLSLLVFFLSGLFLFAKSKPAQARIIVGDCETTEQCRQESGDSRASCDNRVCTVPSVSLPNSSLEEFQKTIQEAKKKNEVNQQRWLGETNYGLVDNLLNSFNTQMVGEVDWQSLRAGKLDQVKLGGALGFTSNLVASVLTNPPVSSGEYFADLYQNFGFAKPAYAQGIGFQGLSKILPLWKAMRNLAYIFFVIVFLFTGLAIMFRVKLDPKTVITIQNAIPKLVVTLILVTFSYAIAGLMIDLIYLLIYIGVLAIGPAVGFDAAKIATEQANFTNLTFLSAVGLLFGGAMRAIWGTVGIIAKGVLSPDFITVILSLLGAILGSAMASLSILIFLVVALFLIIKLFFALLQCYIAIILSVILAPLQITMGVLPGSTGGFNSWFKNLLANILVFPAVSLVLFLGWLLTRTTGPEWTPPVIGVTGEVVPALLGFGMLMLVSKVPDMVKAAFKMKPAGYGTAIGEAFGPAKPAYKAGVSAVITKQEAEDHPGWAGAISAITGIRGGRGRSDQTSTGAPTR